eukprot:scaffold7346_cov245-Pinguiococcus_pyrenoidosus.AAC.42
MQSAQTTMSQSPISASSRGATSTSGASLQSRAFTCTTSDPKLPSSSDASTSAVRIALLWRFSRRRSNVDGLSVAVTLASMGVRDSTAARIPIPEPSSRIRVLLVMTPLDASSSAYRLRTIDPIHAVAPMPMDCRCMSAEEGHKKAGGRGKRGSLRTEAHYPTC